ncbi:MAG: hypothetical protein KF764_34695 [Labilithrix sp.]|nr:hypothetical protein [Labilithrix sp.]MBX3225062.1 hypothetical protein [Labilithrix sp.]
MLLVALASLLVGGCAGGGWETATEVPKAPRRPDGVVLDPPAALPAPSDRAEARGVVALREPLADKDVEEVVQAYIRAFEREDDQALIQLVAEEAASLGRPGSSRQQLIETWRTKMKSFEYQRIAGLEVARISQMERHTYETLGAPDSPERPVEMRPGDLYVRVPIATPRVGSEQLFGDVLVLLLRREDGRLKIAGQADETTN